MKLSFRYNPPNYFVNLRYLKIFFAYSNIFTNKSMIKPFPAYNFRAINVLWTRIKCEKTKFIYTLPENNFVPASFSTYTNEGFFSVRYPSDWSPYMERVAAAEVSMKQFLADEGMGAQAESLQLAFLGGKTMENGNVVYVGVTIEPGNSWPLETLVENTHQKALQDIKQYIEYSRVKTTIDGRKAIIQTYQGEDTDFILTAYTTAYVSSDKFLWTVLCGCYVEDYDSFRVTFDQIVRSLTVEY
jgi:hypothetical protein